LIGSDEVTADRRQRELEQLALRLSRRPEVQQARSAAREVFTAHPNAATPDGRASLSDAADQHFIGAVQLATNADPAHPEVLAICLYDHPISGGEVFPSALHGGLENPDNVYRIVPVSAQWRYELAGRRPELAPTQVTFELMDTAPGVDGIGAHLGMLTDRDLVVDEDGRYTVTIDADPADGRPNHIQCPPEARALFVRDTLSDWHRQRPHPLHVSRVDGPARPRRSEDELARDAAALVPRYARFWNEFRDGFLTQMNLPVNAFGTPMARSGGWGYIDNAAFALAPDEALVFTTDAGSAPYHAVLVGNHWWIAHDASRRSGAFNMTQARSDPDGTFTFVIASDDPGTENWLDPAGQRGGVVQVRWQGAAAGAAPPPPIRDVRVVPVRELGPELPRVSAEQRAAQLADRHTSYLRRIPPS
jgi:hypothetical protein